MKPWQKALGDIRLLGPDIPKFRKDTKVIWDYIQSLEEELTTYSTPNKNKPIKAEINSIDDLKLIVNENCFSIMPNGFKFVITANDLMPLAKDEKGSLAAIPEMYSPPGTHEKWEFDLYFPSAGNMQQFPVAELGGVLWRWEHKYNSIVNPVGLGCHLAIDGRNQPDSKGLHFKVPASIRDGKRSNDFEYASYLMPTAPSIHFDHDYHIEIELFHSGDNDGYFKGSIDGHLVAECYGPNLPTDPIGQDPYIVFGFHSIREKTNTVEFTNIVRTQ